MLLLVHGRNSGHGCRAGSGLIPLQVYRCLGPLLLRLVRLLLDKLNLPALFPPSVSTCVGAVPAAVPTPLLLVPLIPVIQVSSRQSCQLGSGSGSPLLLTKHLLLGLRRLPQLLGSGQRGTQRRQQQRLGVVGRLPPLPTSCQTPAARGRVEKGGQAR